MDFHEWLDDKLDKKGRGSVNELAKRLGINPSGISRMRKAGGRQLKAKDLAIIEKFFGERPPVADDGPSAPAAVPETHRYGDFRLSTVPVTDDTIPVLGTVAAGMWLEVDPLENREERRASIPIPPDPRLPKGATFALIVSGSSINRIAQDGEVLVCTSIAETGIEIMHGDLVIVERRKGQDGLLEVTAKRVYQFADRIELHAESTDPRWQEPIVLHRHDDDGYVNAFIVARVEYVYKSVRPHTR